MVKPNEHYHKIEVPTCQTERTVYKSSLTLPDVEYNLTRLEGQLVRFDDLFTKKGLKDDERVYLARDTLTNARGFLNALKLALSKDRIDVA